MSLSLQAAELSRDHASKYSALAVANVCNSFPCLEDQLFNSRPRLLGEGGGGCFDVNNAIGGLATSSYHAPIRAAEILSLTLFLCKYCEIIM
jgi:hypothetical protein